jgi:hypothetical protein
MLLVKDQKSRWRVTCYIAVGHLISLSPGPWGVAQTAMARKKAAAASLVRPIEEHLKLLKEIWRKGVLQRHLQHRTIDELNDKGGTLLHVACSDTRSFAGSSDALVKLLLQAGADCIGHNSRCCKFAS